MRAVTLATFLLFYAANVNAQGLVGGYALDKATGSALPCIDVALVREDSTVIAKTRTLPGGAFLFPAPAPGRYRISFFGFGLFPVSTAEDSLFPTTNQDRVYRLDKRWPLAVPTFAGTRTPMQTRHRDRVRQTRLRHIRAG